MKMLELIIAAILGVGIFFGGWFTRDLTKPTVVNEYITQQTEVNQKTESVQQNIQGQWTYIDTRTNVNLNIGQITNLIKLTNYSITNKKHLTNK